MIKVIKNILYFFSKIILAKNIFKILKIIKLKCSLLIKKYIVLYDDKQHRLIPINISVNLPENEIRLSFFHKGCDIYLDCSYIH